VGIARVDLYVNGTLLGSDSTEPYGFDWDTGSLAGTSAVLQARAYDAAGNQASSQAVTVTVSQGAGSSAPDTIPPTVALTGISNGGTVSGMVTIVATAADNVAIASLSLYLDGATVSSGNRSSLSYKWNTRKAANGSHTITAVAKDSSGNQTTTTIQVTK
jgi:Bacterial Ig domain